MDLGSLSSINPISADLGCPKAVPELSAASVTGALGGATDFAKSQANTLAGTQTDALKSKISEAQGQLAGLSATAKASAKGIIDSAKSQANAITNSIQSKIPKLDTSAVTDIQGQAGAAMGAIGGMIASVKSDMTSMVGAATSQVSALTGAASALASKYSSSITNSINSLSSSLTASVGDTLNSAVESIKNPMQSAVKPCSLSDPSKKPPAIPSPMPPMNANLSPKLAAAMTNASVANIGNPTPNPLIAPLKAKQTDLNNQISVQTGLIATKQALVDRIIAYISNPNNLTNVTESDMNKIVNSTTSFTPSSVHLSTSAFPEATIDSINTLQAAITTATNTKNDINMKSWDGKSISELDAKILNLQTIDSSKTNDKVSSASNISSTPPLPAPTEPTLNASPTVGLEGKYSQLKAFVKTTLSNNDGTIYYVTAKSPSGASYMMYLYNEFHNNSTKASWEKYIKYIKNNIEICVDNLSKVNSAKYDPITGTYLVPSTNTAPQTHIASVSNIAGNITTYQGILTSMMSDIQTNILPQFALSQTNNPMLNDPKPKKTEAPGIPENVKTQATMLKQVFSDAKTFIAGTIIPSVNDFNSSLLSVISDIQPPYSTDLGWNKTIPTFVNYIQKRNAFKDNLEKLNTNYIQNAYNDIKGGIISNSKYIELQNYLDVDGTNTILTRLYYGADIRQYYYNVVYKQYTDFVGTVGNDFSNMELVFTKYNIKSYLQNIFISYLNMGIQDNKHAGGWIEAMNKIEQSISDLDEIING